MARCKTVTIKTNKGLVTINEEDFDEKTHKRASDEDVSRASASSEKASAASAAKEKKSTEKG